MQERHNSIANTLESRLYCTNHLIYNRRILIDSILIYNRYILCMYAKLFIILKNKIFIPFSAKTDIWARESRSMPWPLKWKFNWHRGTFLAATKQLYEWFSPSVRPSVCPSVCLSVRLSHLFDYVPIILSSWNFQELLPVTKVTSMQKVKVRGQRSRSQRSQPNLTVSGL